MLTILSNITTQTNAFISKKDIALESLVTINLILMYSIGTITYVLFPTLFLHNYLMIGINNPTGMHRKYLIE